MSDLKVGVGGLGAIGLEVAKALRRGIEGFTLQAVSARDGARARGGLDLDGIDVVAPSVLAATCHIVVEALPAAHFDEIAVPAVESGRILIVSSVGALLTRSGMIDRARTTGARILAPSGAIVGIDALKAAAQGTIHSVRIATRKPPAALLNTPWLDAKGVDVLKITQPTRLFEGPASEAALAFPASINVSATLALAGIGPARTRVEIWADPTVRQNTHRITVTSDSSDFILEIRNTPSPLNPKTGIITAQSVIAMLRQFRAPLVVGT